VTLQSFVILAFVLSVCAEGAFLTSESAAREQAKKQNKPLLISFFGIWCPPCNEFEESVFTSPAFTAKAKSFVLLKVDADSKSSWPMKDKYRVGGYPTLIFTDSLGEEIYRVVGLRSSVEMTKVMDMVLSAKGSKLKDACQSDRENDLWRCVLVSSERKELANAQAALKKLEGKLKPGTARYELARTYVVENEGEDLKRDGLERLMQEFPSSPQALYWAVLYTDMFESKTGTSFNKDLIEKVLAFYPQMLKDPKQEELGISVTDGVERCRDPTRESGEGCQENRPCSRLCH
jgi:thioredoxin-related protein